MHHETDEHLEMMVFAVTFSVATDVNDIIGDCFTKERTQEILEGWRGHWNFEDRQDKIKLFLSQL